MKLYRKNDICYLLLIFLLFGCGSEEQLSEKNVVAVNGVKLHYTIEGTHILDISQKDQSPSVRL